MRAHLRAKLRRLFGINISQITPLLLVGGQFDPEQWPAISALGVRAVLSLQAERVDRFIGPPPERALRLHVIDFTAPTQAQLDEGVRFIATAHAAELPVFVHCHGGIGRAPLMAAAYLMASHGHDHREALALLRAVRPFIAPNPLQLACLRTYEARLRTARPDGHPVV
jgi:protein-tyrosine phosphatase